MSLLEQFDYLRNNDPQKRLDATLKIFSILDMPSKRIVNIASAEELKEQYGTDVQYTFSRLVKGLASNRESARLGFSAALSELLRALGKIEIDMVLAAIEQATTPTGNIKGQDVRDCQFGRLFGLQALCTSGILTREGISLDELSSVFGQLFELSMSKGWLRESCASVVIQILDSLTKANSPVLKQAVEAVHGMLYDAELSKTMEGIAVGLKCQELGSKRLIEDWKHSDILHSENMKSINKILRDVTAEDESGDSDKQTGTWKPKLHFSWLLIIRAILHSDVPSAIQFSDFWRIIVDEGLFSASASHERKFWGLQLFNNLIRDLDVASLSTLFSPNFWRTLTNHISQNDRYLHKAAKATTASMVSAAETDSAKVLPILTSIWNHSLMFDRLSKDKTCETLMLLTPAKSMQQLVQLLIDQVSTQDTTKVESPKAIESSRQYIADCFLQLLRSGKVANDGPWVTDVLDFLCINGFFKFSKHKSRFGTFTPELSDASRSMFRSRLQSALGSLMPNDPEPCQSRIYALYVVELIGQYKSKKHFELLLQPDEMVSAVIEKSEKKLSKLQKRLKKVSTQDQALAFILLYSLSLLQIYNGDVEAAQVLADLDECYSRIFARRIVGKQQEDNEEQDVMVVLTDLLISFLSRESVLFRKLVDSVFAVFAPRLNRGAMDLLLNVLAASESGEGLFDKDDDEDADDDDDDDNDEEDDEAIAQDEADRELDSDTSDSEVAEADAEDDNDAELDAALASALSGSKRKLSAMSNDKDESDFVASDDDDEELMNDDEMLAMDATLENIFKRRKLESGNNTKKDRETIKASTVQLKRKVLELLDQFVKLRPDSELVIEMILPVLQAARTSTDSQFTEKALQLVRQKITKSKVLPVLAAADGLAQVMDLINKIHVEAERSTTPPHLAACSQASLFLVRISLTESMSHIASVIQIYGTSQQKWIMKKNSHLTTGFFVDFINWLTQWRSNLHKTRTAK